MARLLKQIKESQQGQALIIVLALLALGGPLIVATISHAATSVNSVRTIERSVKALYAAEAGVKYGLLHLEPDIYPLTENINQMEVTVQVETSNVTHLLYFGELMRGGQHSNYLRVDGEIVWDEEVTPPAYKYTITVTWQSDPGEPEIHLREVGGRLPVGYGYQSESAADFANNLSSEDPDELEDEEGAYMLSWDLRWRDPLPFVSATNPVQTQIFYITDITGEGDPADYYGWVLTNRRDVGEVSEITGVLYTITATAICPESGETAAKIVSDVLKQEDTTDIISWQVSK